VAGISLHILFDGMNKKLFREFSIVDFFLSILYRAILAGVTIVSFMHYDENPAAFWIIAVLCVVPLIFIGSDEIIVYENKVEQNKNSIISLVLRKARVYYIDDMNFATLSVPKESTTGEIAGAVVMTLLLPKSHVGSKSRNPIIFRLVNGKSVYFLTGLSSSQMQRVVDNVNELIYQKENTSSQWGNVDEYLNDIN
jgi:hypothetical protein